MFGRSGGGFAAAGAHQASPAAEGERDARDQARTPLSPMVRTFMLALCARLLLIQRKKA